MTSQDFWVPNHMLKRCPLLNVSLKYLILQRWDDFISKQCYSKEKYDFVGAVCVSKKMLEKRMKSNRLRQNAPYSLPLKSQLHDIGRPEYAHFSQQYRLVGAREGLCSHSSCPHSEVPRCLRSYDPMVVLPRRTMWDRVHNFLGWSSG